VDKESEYEGLVRFKNCGKKCLNFASFSSRMDVRRAKAGAWSFEEICLPNVTWSIDKESGVTRVDCWPLSRAYKLNPRSNATFYMLTENLE
jgi:hypothetical protein